MASPWHLAITGTFVVVGKEPDGDSARFRADDASHFEHLRNGHRVRPSRDGTVQLRVEAIDATELHYMNQAQNFAAEGRDHFLADLGFSNVRVQDGSTIVDSADPADGVRGAILTRAADVHGRPISWVLVGDRAAALHDGRWAQLTEDLLRASVNAEMLSSGFAYYTVYTSTALRPVLRQLASAARAANLGVWNLDRTGEFHLVDRSSIGPGPAGQVILPKLFRRCTDYLSALEKGFQGTLAEWILSVSTSPARDENDRVVLADGTEVPLTALILEQNTMVRFQPDLLDITFVEK